MATVTHPAAAQIYGIEFWQGRPFLVVEFLPGGTLEDRLQHGPVAPLEAVAVIAALADALATCTTKDSCMEISSQATYRVHVERVAKTVGFRPDP